MMRRLFAFLMLCALLCSPAQGGRAVEADDGEAGAVWTAIIPDAFPNYIYTWHMKDDGSYREDGRDAAGGKPIQPTLSGRWTTEGPHMVLRQDDQPYVFDGVVLGNLYAGTLYFGGNARSRFCAARGEMPPDPGTFSTCSTVTTSASRIAPRRVSRESRLGGEATRIPCTQEIQLLVESPPENEHIMAPSFLPSCQKLR